LFESQPAQPIGDIDRHCRGIHYQLGRRRQGQSCPAGLSAEIQCLAPRLMAAITPSSPIDRFKHAILSRDTGATDFAINGRAPQAELPGGHSWR